MTTTSPTKDVVLPKKTKSFVLDGATAAKIEALADGTHQTESALANRILNAGATQMILERTGRSRQGVPHRLGFGSIEGSIRIRRAGEPESDYPKDLAFEIIEELTSAGDALSALLALVYVHDLDTQNWRRPTAEEAYDLVVAVHSGSRLLVVTPAGARWLVVEIRDLLDRSVVPPLRDVVARLRRLPTLCPACGALLTPSSLPASMLACSNTVCGRHYDLDLAGNLVARARAADVPSQEAGPLSFAQLRGILPVDAFSDEALRAVRVSSRTLP
jgi:hypothetical protein